MTIAIQAPMLHQVVNNKIRTTDMIEIQPFAEFESVELSSILRPWGSFRFWGILLFDSFGYLLAVLICWEWGSAERHCGFFFFGVGVEVAGA
eukprot:4096223-Amphidinium_carterae.2